MKTLSAGNTITGVAPSGTVKYSIYGLEVKNGVDTYKLLAQGSLPSTAGTLYTVPADTIAMIREIDIVGDTSAQIVGVQLLINSNAITPPFILEANGLAHYGLEGWKFYDKYGFILTKRAEVNVLFGTSPTPPSADGLPDGTRYYQYIP